MKQKFIFRKVLKLLAYCISIFVAVSCLFVVAYKFINPPITPLMLMRSIESIGDDDFVGIEKNWCDWDEISPHFFRACIAAEDARFLSHSGIDWKAVENAKRYNEIHKGKRVHGASTISMQTAKNTFLWHGRNFVRKGLEAYFTVLIEAVWGKKRILEVYVNVVEMGNGIYGVDAAAQAYFNKKAAKLNKHQAALLAAILPNPRKYSAKNPSAYIQNRAAFIEKRMNSIALPK
ncbi:MAG: monofunctional biosynthetic peptidoglycan transglycosylase [Ignavibacteria bacterium]|jgi:monofunctional biosynthetic peptidoglycan transglycosylase|nr:monofunctional biosynthetic peptidoglycan transglycosylase [Ignavibacteria bacterium]